MKYFVYLNDIGCGKKPNLFVKFPLIYVNGDAGQSQNTTND